MINNKSNDKNDSKVSLSASSKNVTNVSNKIIKIHDTKTKLILDGIKNQMKSDTELDL